MRLLRELLSEGLMEWTGVTILLSLIIGAIVCGSLLVVMGLADQVLSAQTGL